MVRCLPPCPGGRRQGVKGSFSPTTLPSLEPSAEPFVQRSHTLDAIRGIAILQVLVWHYLVPSLNHHGTFLSLLLSASLNLTWTGVDLFFVLSGFLIGGILMDNREATNMFSVFYARRILRILPLYALTIALFQLFGPPASLWPYLTFTQNMVWAADGHWGPTWTGVTWSLAVEEQFYLVLPLIVWCIRPTLLPIVVVALCCIAPVARWVCAEWLYPSHYASYLLMPCRMDALFGGVLVAWFVRRHRSAGSGRRRETLLVWRDRCPGQRFCHHAVHGTAGSIDFYDHDRLHLDRRILCQHFAAGSASAACVRIRRDPSSVPPARPWGIRNLSVPPAAAECPHEIRPSMVVQSAAGDVCHNGHGMAQLAVH